jgi:hypothetical protein
VNLKRYSYEGSNTVKVWASRDSVVGIVTGLRAGLSRVRISVVVRDSCVFQNAHTGSEAQPSSYSIGTGVLFWISGNRGVKLTTELLPVSRSRVTRAILLLPLYSLMVCTGIIDLFYLYVKAWTLQVTHFMGHANSSALYKLFGQGRVGLWSRWQYMISPQPILVLIIHLEIQNSEFYYNEYPS